MYCDKCGNNAAYRFHMSERGVMSCDRCGTLGKVYIPDVYFDGKPVENLAAEPIEFSSRGEKARYMREHNIIEVGDTYHGSRELPPVEKTYNREKALREAGEAVREARKKLRLI